MKLMGSRGIPLMVTALNLAWGLGWVPGNTGEESELGNGLLLSKASRGWMFRAQVLPRINTRLGWAQEDMENGEALFPQGISGL